MAFKCERLIGQVFAAVGYGQAQGDPAVGTTDTNACNPGDVCCNKNCGGTCQSCTNEKSDKDTTLPHRLSALAFLREDLRRALAQSV